MADQRSEATSSDRFARRNWEPGALPTAPDMPPGAPIGQPALEWLGA